MPKALTLEETPAHAAELFLIVYGREPTPEQLARLELNSPPYRECDLLSAVQGWIFAVGRSDGLHIDHADRERDRYAPTP